MTKTYRRHTLNCEPQILADGRFGPRLVVTEHQADASVDHRVDVGPDVYRTAQEASQAAVRAGIRWIDDALGPLHRHGAFGFEISATSHDDGWTGDVRIYGSSSDAAIFDRRTNYLVAPGVFRDDALARNAAREHAIHLIDSRTAFEWEDM
ncbi:hypothetical protein [Cupriavidus oxalaticus]|uniref:Uncharacterized protein n=1 Tax=Cupriavidus oxalaticus TaxID=96344 RepID=A0ABX7HZY2_9BURK|nr:hypothetical protein [Cupriavidus oxalaticus]QRQ86293.1 hypothetical protein JTE91_24105 [Cupriavidus oxalaticus]QRQ95380.1 hypothetical protein JTE92_18155 [Cupriavidus oxalaticus]WQD84034.1 hypothetical protein U0036_05855 [Cupriavidus oxalaticus]